MRKRVSCASMEGDGRYGANHPTAPVPEEDMRDMYNSAADAISVYILHLPSGADPEEAEEAYIEWIRQVFRGEIKGMRFLPVGAPAE